MSGSTPRDSFTFLHAADVHLDSPLTGLARYEGAPVDAIRGATRAALRNLVDLALAEAVDFLLVAGDLYDGDWKDYSTGLFFVEQMARLGEAGIPVLVIAGNHDAASHLTRHLHPPANVRVFRSDEAHTHLLDQVRVAVHGQGYAQPAVTEDLSRHYPAPVTGRFNIGLLHTALSGRPGHLPYAPCTADGLRARGYDYWALGHVHQREIVSEDPWIVFPGNLQGRHVRETGPKGATLVTVSDGIVACVEHRPLDVVRWFDASVDLSGCARVEDAWGEIQSVLARCADEAPGMLAAVRVRLTGACAADTALRAAQEQVGAQCRALAAGVSGEVWVEKVLVQTSPPADRAPVRDDALAGLPGAIERLSRDDAALAAMAQEFADLRAKAPQLLQGEEPFDPTDPAVLRGALDDVRALLIERLLARNPTR